MHWLNECTSEEIVGGQHRATIGIKSRAYWAVLPGGGRVLRENASAWLDGDADYPDVVSLAPLPVRSAGDGRYRIYPVLGDFTRYLEVVRPYVKPAGSWTPLALANKVRAGNRLTWTGPNVDLTVTHAGHYLGWQMPLKDGYMPPSSQFAVPMSLVGLTRSGGTILADGKPVLTMRPPAVYDADNPMDTRPIAWQFGAIGGQTGVLFTLPSLVGMTRPVVDPTWSSQPGAAEGIDTEIYSVSPTFNYGALGDMWVGEHNGVGDAVLRTLIKFNLASIPSSALISSAVLSLYALTNASFNARTFRLFRLLRAWTEGTKSGSAPADGATWNTYDGTNNWTTAGGFGATDCEQTDIGSRAFTATETLDEFKVFTLTPTTKAALDLGNGWLGKADTETDDAYNFPSSDAADANTRPKLELVYLLPSGGIGRGRIAVLSRSGW